MNIILKEAYTEEVRYAVSCLLCMSNLFLFTGENSFTLRKKKNTWLREFVQKHGEENLSRIEGKGLTMPNLLDEVSSAPFIAQHRLIVINGIPKWKKEDIAYLRNQIHPDVIVLFVDPKPDKRLSGVKELLACASITTFAPYSPMELRSWIREFVAGHGASIGADAYIHLIEKVGEDQDMLSTELQKLCLYAQGEIIPAHIDDVVVPSREWLVWNLTDLLSRKKQKDAFLYAHELLRSGHDPYSLWNILLWMIRNLVIVSGALHDGMRNPNEIAKNHGLNPMSVRALCPLADSISTQNLCTLVHEACRMDIGLKSGQYRSTMEEPQELLALIDRLILKCA
jgi:DNA polymerase III subunit delta